MQILHPFAGSIQQYAEEIADPDRYRPDSLPAMRGQQPLTAHGFYSRTLVDAAFDGVDPRAPLPVPSLSSARFLCCRSSRLP